MTCQLVPLSLTTMHGSSLRSARVPSGKLALQAEKALVKARSLGFRGFERYCSWGSVQTGKAPLQMRLRRAAGHSL
jgi:hypothetical protein